MPRAAAQSTKALYKLGLQERLATAKDNTAACRKKIQLVNFQLFVKLLGSHIGACRFGIKRVRIYTPLAAKRTAVKDNE
jgi:hypothetical protein